MSNNEEKVTKEAEIKERAHKLNFAVAFYDSMDKASLIKDAGYEAYLNTEGIRFPSQFTQRLYEAKQMYVKAYLKNATFYANDGVSKEKWFAELAKKTLAYSTSHGGATIFPGTGLAITGGYAVGGFAPTVSVSSLTQEVLEDYIRKYYDDYYRYDEYMIGTWYDEINGQWDIDVSVVVFKEADAQQIAKDKNQKAYFDLYTFESKRPDGSLYKKDESTEEPKKEEAPVDFDVQDIVDGKATTETIASVAKKLFK